MMYVWIPFHVSIQGNKRADVLANEGSTSGTLFQDQAGLTTVNKSADRMAGKLE
jgi:ribonuclease HI